MQGKTYKKDILKLRSQGKTYNEIQRELGCSKGTISYHLGTDQKKKTKQRSQKRRSEIRRILSKIKEDAGCMDCKKSYPYFVLEFDHARGKKIEAISKMISWRPVDEIYEEIKKCDVVCANCHRFRTQKRRTLENL